MSARRKWARAFIAVAPDAPAYGSPEWLALPDGSPAKVAATVRAAECWARDGDELEERLWVEVTALSRANKRAEDAAYVADIERHRATWAGGVYRPVPDLPAQLEAEFYDWIEGAA